MKPTNRSVVVQAVLAAKEEMRNKFWSEHLKIEYAGAVRVVSRKKVADWCEENHLDPDAFSSWTRYMHEHYLHVAPVEEDTPVLSLAVCPLTPPVKSTVGKVLSARGNTSPVIYIHNRKRG